ncbi:hypothetical protein COO91_08351 [Nostoc flagelliforme CCNUN1]|uniref:Uncharacterized protein n=1 Tax=Nostoc flagelliforme CCNUN1 TaxID=2038116 RepID=A0A2K8T3K4_9NOSO|nr:hypothetical protein [Nostoc flagelliforme]AUB42239.1 hypothetical protein COO91_08351 [Nostoc flagelliforme CCNUN1]
MTVQELIKKLETFPLEMEVAICTPESDYSEIESIHFDRLGTVVEIEVSGFEDEEY